MYLECHIPCVYLESRATVIIVQSLCVSSALETCTRRSRKQYSESSEGHYKHTGRRPKAGGHRWICQEDSAARSILIHTPGRGNEANSLRFSKPKTSRTPGFSQTLLNPQSCLVLWLRHCHQEICILLAQSEEGQVCMEF